MTQWTVLYLYLIHSEPLSELSEVHETQTQTLVTRARALSGSCQPPMCIRHQSQMRGERRGRGEYREGAHVTRGVTMVCTSDARAMCSGPHQTAAPLSRPNVTLHDKQTFHLSLQKRLI